VAVTRADGTLEVFSLPGHRVEDALAQFQFSPLRLHLGPGSLQKHPAKNFRRLFLARNQHARTGPGQTAQALLHVNAEGQRLEAGQVADALSDVLVERDGIAETATAWMR